MHLVLRSLAVAASMAIAWASAPLAAVAQAPAAQPPSSSPALPASTPAPAAPPAIGGAIGVTRATLANGLQVVVLRDPLAPVVATWLNYRTGASEEPITGIAHAQEHMMFRGSRTLTASQFADTTAITGGAFNADTQSQITQYFFEMPSQYLDLALHLEASRAQGILDTQALWDQERGAITQEVTRDNSSAPFRLLDKVLGSVMAGTPYANFGLGTVESFKKIQASDLRTFYDKWYHPNNAVYVIAGNVDPKTTIAKVRALFEKIPSRPRPARKPVTLGPLHAATLVDRESTLPVALEFVGFRVPGYDSPDYAASQVLEDVFNSPRGALYELQASGKALATFAQAQTYPKAGVSLVGSAVPAGGDGQQAVSDINGVINALKEKGVPPELVDAAKRRELAQAQFRSNSVQGLASLWSDKLAIEGRTPDEDLTAISRVTVDDVNRLLRTYYDTTTATAAIALPKAAGIGGLSQRGGENVSVVPTEHKGLPAFARSVLSNLRVPERTTAPADMMLSNGMRLIVQPEHVTHTVVVRGSIKNNPDVQEPAGKEGVGSILDRLFTYGTTTYDRVKYQEQLDAISATVHAGSAFSLDVLSGDFARGVDLLADQELHPALPEAAFTTVKTQTVGALTGQVKSPDFLTELAVINGLYPKNDPTRRYATPESAETVTLDDVKSYYGSAFRPDLATIVVVGDVTSQQARTAVERAFNGWHATGPKPQVDVPPVPPNAPAVSSVSAAGRIQAEVTLAQTIPLVRRDPDYATLRLANAVLSGGFYASLLYHDLRELHGYVYNVGSSVNAGRTRSSFRVTYGADPKNVDRAARLVRDDLASLQRRPLTADRLTRAKALVLGGLPVRIESYTSLASQLLADASDDLPLDQQYREAAQILNATPATVRAAMTRYIRPNSFVRVTQGP